MAVAISTKWSPQDLVGPSPYMYTDSNFWKSVWTGHKGDNPEM